MPKKESTFNKKEAKSATGLEAPLQPPHDFAVKDCSLLTMTTGRYAQNLREMSDHLQEVHRGCVYHIFWANRLLPRMERPDFQNDIAVWTRNALHDHPLSERLGIINPTRFSDLEALRREVIDIIEERLEERETVPWAQRGQEFFFRRSQTVVFDTRLRIGEPKQLCDIIPQMPIGSIYYHFIDARRRDPQSMDDFSSWLKGFGDEYNELIHNFANLDPYFVSLTELRERVADVITRFFSC
jgi:hypothetical protein